ncbi:MAG: TetR/AcrR family transcriptional regulator [Lachnospiraceae bacterium]|nr:TetR/AcrR family transcriptional regulator [Lachnospiraceae bacterium]
MKITNNPTALRSQRAIKESLRSLMKEDSFSHISVTEICQQASVTRQAFYTNFRSKEDVLASILQDIQHEWTEELRKHPADSLTDQTLVLFETWYDHRELLDLLVRDRLSTLLVSNLLPENFQIRFVGDIPSRKRRQLEPMARAMIIGGISNGLWAWSQNQYRYSCEDMALVCTNLEVTDD